MELEHLLIEETEATRMEGNFQAHIVYDWAGLLQDDHRYEITVYEKQRGRKPGRMMHSDAQGEYHWKNVYEDHAASLTKLEEHANAEGFEVVSIGQDDWQSVA